MRLRNRIWSWLRAVVRRTRMDLPFATQGT